MSHHDIFRCNYPPCEKESEEPFRDGWVHFNCLDDGNSLMLGDRTLLANLEDTHFCSVKCLMHYLNGFLKSASPLLSKAVNNTIPKLGRGSRAEYNWIKDCPTLTQCLSGFRDRYPGRKNVTDSDLSAIWNHYHPDQEEVIEEGSDYSDKELAVLYAHESHRDAWAAYTSAFPGSKRKRSSIKIKWLRNWESTEGKRRAKELRSRESVQENETPPSSQNIDEPAPNQGAPHQESSGLFVGAKVLQVKGKNRAYGVGEVLEIRMNGDVVAQFYGSRKVLSQDHFELYVPGRATSQGTADQAATAGGGQS